MLDRFIDGVEAAVASIVADMRAQCDAQVRELKTELELFRARSDATQARYQVWETEITAEIRERLAELNDGEDCDMEAVNRRLDEQFALRDTDARHRDEEMLAQITKLDEVETEVERLVGEYVAGAVAALPPAEPGRDVDPADVERLVAEHVERAVAALPPPERGQDADPEVMRAQVADAVSGAVAALPAPENGKDADEDAIVARVLEAMPTKQELRGAPGRLPLVGPWSDVVHYEGEVVTWRGSTWQARCDTGRAPPHDDWTCLAASGEAGRSPSVRELWDAGVDYDELDIVALNGGSFIARCDNPGPCPGDGWQLLTSPGSRGKGLKPEELRPLVAAEVSRAVAALPPVPKLNRLELDDTGLLTLALDNGDAVCADFAPVLRR